MAFPKPTSNPLLLFLLISTLLLVILPIQGFGEEDTNSNSLPPKGFSSTQTSRLVRSSRRLMIGSSAPNCTYNECRGCRFKCSAEQVPVDANDPMNSAYHYRCVCHR